MTRFSSIASSSADWVFGVARLISSASRSCVNTGPCWNWKWRRPASSCDTTCVPMMSAGMRSGVNWMRENSRCSASAQGLHQQRLAQARHAFQQHVTGREQAGEYAVDQVVMTDDAPLDLAPAAHPAARARAGQARLVAHGASSRADGCSGAGRAPWLRFRKYRRTNSL